MATAALIALGDGALPDPVGVQGQAS
jgi:hypothetical protein